MDLGNVRLCSGKVGVGNTGRVVKRVMVGGELTLSDLDERGARL